MVSARVFWKVNYLKGDVMNHGYCFGRETKADRLHRQRFQERERKEREARERLNKAAPALLEACEAQHKAIDKLFALLISIRGDYLPTKSGQPWRAFQQGVAAIALAKEEG